MAEGSSVRVGDAPASFRWGPVWAGFFVIAALQIVMQLLGIAVGLSAWSSTSQTAQRVSIWAGSWSALSTLSAFFFGAWFSVAAAATATRSEAIARAIAVWAFGTTLGIVLASAGLGGAVAVARALLMPPGARGSGYTIGAAWATFGTLALSLLCALGGGLIGGGRRRRARAAATGAVVERPA
jgi:hypothetical protein